MNAVAGLFFIFLATAITADSGTTFRTCKKSVPKYNECLKGALTEAMVKLRSGLREYKILPLEPLKVNRISIGGKDGSVSLRQEYKDVELHGLTRGLEVRKLDIDWNKLLFVIETHNPQVDFVGSYKVEGKILLLQIRGSGHSNITMLDLKTENRIQFDKYEKDGETYLKVRSFEVKFSPAKVRLNFENLFDGDPVLAKPIETLLAENGDLLFKELQAPYETSFGRVFAQIGTELFRLAPMNRVFPE